MDHLPYDQEQRDWEQVVALKPQGHVEIQNVETRMVYHGPIESIEVDANDFVHIRLTWVAETKAPLAPGFDGKWRKASDEEREIVFPNLIVPFIFERTESKGPRVRFGYNLLYLNAVPGVDPTRVEGLQL
ncbi:MAG: hypothetical protein AAB490_04580 [Patescibacteria group bacterium]